MTPGETQVLVTALTAIGTIIGVFLTARLGKSGSREINIINELQEEVKNSRERSDALEKRVEELFNKVQKFLTRDALWEIHANRLELQVVDLGGIPHPRPFVLAPVKQAKEEEE